MLVDLREKSQSFLIFILFGILIFVFIFFFGPQSQGFTADSGPVADPSGWAARVNGDVITQRQVDLSVRRQAYFLGAENSPKLKRDTLLQLVDLKLIEQRAHAAGITASEEEVDSFIVSKRNGDWQIFYNKKGRFDTKRYTSQVRQGLGVSTDVYRESKRAELLAQRYIAMLSSQIKVSTTEAREMFDRSKRSWTLDYIAIDPTTVEATEASPEEGAAFAKKHPEKIKAYYEANKKRYSRDQEVRIRRVLVKMPKGADEAAKTAARKQIDALLAKAKTPGTDFEALAKENSQGFYKTYGGDMGWQTKSNTAKTDFAIYAGLKKGEISDVQQNLAGLWFVKADDVKPAVNKTLADVTPELGVLLAKGERQTAAALIEAKAILAKAKGVDALEKALPTPAVPVAPVAVEGEVAPAPVAAAKAKYAVKTTSPIRESRQAVNRIPGIGESAELAKLLPTLTDKAPLVDKVLDIEGRLYIVRLKAHVEPTDADFEKDKSTLVQRLQGARTQQLFGGWQQMLFGSARGRDQLRTFGAGAIFTALGDGAKTELNDEIYPLPIASAKGKGAKAR